MTNQSLALTQPSGGLPAVSDWNQMMTMAETLAASGMLPGHLSGKPAAVAAIMLKGNELGVPAMYALNNIVFIQGKTTANSELMLALIYRDHGSDAIRWVEATNDAAIVEYKRRGDTSYKRHAFTMEDARRAGLLSGPNKANYEKYPGAMLRARCISALARMAFPDSIGGMMTSEELGARVTPEGDFIDVAPAAPRQQQQPRQQKPTPVIREVPVSRSAAEAFYADHATDHGPVHMDDEPDDFIDVATPTLTDADGVILDAESRVPATVEQLKAIHDAREANGWSTDELRTVVRDRFGKGSLKSLTEIEANTLVTYLNQTFDAPN